MIVRLLVRAECVHTNVLRALAHIVATKLGIILLLFSFFLPSSQKGFAYDFEFLDAFLSNNKNKIWPKKMGETIHPPPNRHSWVDSRRSVCAMGK